MRECLEFCKKLIIMLCEVLYLVKDFLALLIMSIIASSLSPTENDRTMVILLTLVMFWVCMVLRQIHKEYLTMMRRELAHKRFTRIDNYGNPYIKAEDFPEVVDYLYRLEEAENVKQRTEDRKP